MVSVTKSDLPQWGDPQGIWGRIALMLMAASILARKL